MFDPFDTLNPEPSAEPIVDPETSDIARGSLDQTGMNYEGVTSGGFGDDLGTDRDFREDLGTDRQGTLSDGLGTGPEYFDGTGTGTSTESTDFDPSTYQL